RPRWRSPRPATWCAIASRRRPLGLHVRKGSIAAVEDRGRSRERLPPLDDDVAVARVDLHREADASDALRGDDGRAAAGEGLVDVIAALAVVDDRPAHALDRLLRAVCGRFVLVAAAADRPQGRLVARALPVSV